MTAIQKTSSLTDFDRAPGIFEGSMNHTLTAEDCNLDYWISHVAQGTWKGLVGGHRPETGTPNHMKVDGPFRQALIEELGFRSVAEAMATRAIGLLVEISPDSETMEFFATQLLDEARHARVFRNHLVEMNLPAKSLDKTIQETSGQDIENILNPLVDFAMTVIRDQQDFIGGVAILTILVEGVLAPLAELSERKWRPIDPAAADIERGAAIDEVRHLTVGSSILKKSLENAPHATQRVKEILAQGDKLWEKLPIKEVAYRREMLFQRGLEQFPELVGDYELQPGLPLINTSVEDRLGLALKWTEDMQKSRLRYVGLSGD